MCVLFVSSLKSWLSHNGNNIWTPTICLSGSVLHSVFYVDVDVSVTVADDAAYLHFKRHFPGGPGLPGSSMSSCWILLELRTMEVVVTSGAVSHGNLPPNHLHQQTNTQFVQSGYPSCRAFRRQSSGSKQPWLSGYLHPASLSYNSSWYLYELLVAAPRTFGHNCSRVPVSYLDRQHNT